MLSDEEGLIRCDHVRGRIFRRGESMGQAEPNGLPATREDILKLFCTSQTQFHVQEEEAQSFLERLKSWGGEWMWEGLQLRDDDDISWVAESLKNKSIVCVTDGSYMKDVAPDICSVGWVLLRKQSGRRILGHFVERSPDTSSYRGELLGMLVIRLFCWWLKSTLRSSLLATECAVTTKELCTHLERSQSAYHPGKQTQIFSMC